MVARIDLTPVIGVLLAILAVVAATLPATDIAWRTERLPMDGFVESDLSPTIVTINTDGSLVIGSQGGPDRASSLTTLPRDACAATAGPDCRRSPVFVRGAPDANYQDFLSAMQTLKAAGFRADFLNEEIQ